MSTYPSINLVRPASEPLFSLQSRASRTLAWLSLCITANAFVVASMGCGTTKSFTATEQLLVSDAVDSSVAQIDFRPLAGRKAFLDTAFMPIQKGTPNPNPSLVHSDYVTSSLRQQLTAAGVMLCEKRDEAEVILEVRLGALGFDGHAMSYGIPASSTISSAANTLSGAPMLPALPEISFARKEAKNGAAKVAIFAYERDTLQPVWQSGIVRSSSTARDTWLLGIGPMQSGTIYQGTRFAGGKLRGPIARMVPHEDDEPETLADYKRTQVFAAMPKEKPGSQTAGTTPDAGSKLAEGSTAATSSSSSDKSATAKPNTDKTAKAESVPAKSPASTATAASNVANTTASTGEAPTALKLPQPPPMSAIPSSAASQPAPVLPGPSQLPSPSQPVQAAMHIDDKPLR